MSSGYSGRLWTCPFLRWDEPRRIHCEGGCVALPDERSFADYATRYCTDLNGWRRCTLARAMSAFYEREEAAPCDGK